MPIFIRVCVGFSFFLRFVLSLLSSLKPAVPVSTRTPPLLRHFNVDAFFLLDLKTLQVSIAAAFGAARRWSLLVPMASSCYRFDKEAELSQVPAMASSSSSRLDDDHHSDDEDYDRFPSATGFSSTTSTTSSSSSRFLPPAADRSWSAFSLTAVDAVSSYQPFTGTKRIL